MTSRTPERAAPLAAALTALAAFACCVPLGLTGAASIVVLGGFFDRLQPWFMTAAAVLLAVGAFQLYRRQRVCSRKGRRFSLAVLALSATIVLLVMFFPQTVAGWIADYIL